MAGLVPIDVTLRDIENTASIDSRIRKKAEKLSQYYDRIEYCNVVVDMPKKHPHQGKLYNVRVETGVPGKRLMANHHQGENLYTEIRDAFAAIKRQLDEYANVQRGDIKTHTKQLMGEIVRIFPQHGYGFIEDIDGDEYYFQYSNLTNGSKQKLDVGKRVQFQEIPGGETLQAGHIRVTD